jgi:hypothetical protein
MGISRSRGLDTPERLESQLSIGIHRIPTKLPYSTELELGKPRRTRTNFSRASTLAHKSGSPLGLRTSPLSLLYNELTWEHYRKLNLTFFTPICRGGYGGGVFVGGREDLHHKFEVV